MSTPTPGGGRGPSRVGLCAEAIRRRAVLATLGHDPVRYGASGVVVTGWDPQRLADRAERLASEVAAQETHLIAAAGEALGVVSAELALDGDLDEARAAMHVHLRAVADDPDRGILRWTYPTAVAELEAGAGMSAPAGPST